MSSKPHMIAWLIFTIGCPI